MHSTISGRFTRILALLVLAAPLWLAEPGGALAVDLATSIRKALGADPRIPAGQLEVEAVEGALIQAGKRPNPELAVEIEDFGGTGDYAGFNKAVLTISIQKKIEFGDKRDARIAVAIGKQDVANAEIAVAMREIISQTKVDYIQVLGAQQRVELLAVTAKRFEDLLPLLRRRSEAGASLPADLSRGELALGKARVAIDKAKAELVGARRQLVSNWSGSLGDAVSAAGRLRHNGHPLPAAQSLLSGLDEHPVIRAWAAVYAQRDGELRLQRATAVPDLTASAGVKRIYETDDTAFRVGGSIPLPFYDRNEGAIQEAERRLAKVEFEREAARRMLKRRVIDAFGDLEASCIEARRLLAVVVPIARRAAENVRSGFDQGRLSVKELLDANQDYYEADIQQLDADIRCHAAAAKIETLVTRTSLQSSWQAVVRRQ